MIRNTDISTLTNAQNDALAYAWPWTALSALKHGLLSL